MITIEPELEEWLREVTAGLEQTPEDYLKSVLRQQLAADEQRLKNALPPRNATEDCCDQGEWSYPEPMEAADDPVFPPEALEGETVFRTADAETILHVSHLRRWERVRAN